MEARVNEEYVQILEELRLIRGAVQDVREKQSALTEQVKPVSDHEARIRLLERWRYGLPAAGGIAVMSAALSAYTATKGA